MDYFLELAGVPDVREAIQLDESQDAKSLLLYDFLRDEHPTTRTAEVVHAFYKNHELASRVWRNLRYCNAERLKLAEHVLRNQGSWRWTSRLTDVDPLSLKYAPKFAEQPLEAVRAYGPASLRRPAVRRRAASKRRASRAVPRLRLRILQEKRVGSSLWRGPRKKEPRRHA